MPIMTGMKYSFVRVFCPSPFFKRKVQGYQLFLRMPTVTWEPTPAWETHRACLPFSGICKLCQSLGFCFPHFFQILGSPWNLSYLCCNCQRHSAAWKIPVAPTACIVPISPPDRLEGHFPGFPVLGLI